MSLSVVLEYVGKAHAVGEQLGPRFGTTYLLSRALGLALDAVTFSLAFAQGEAVLGYMFLAHFLFFRAPMLLIAPLQCRAKRRRIRGLGTNRHALTLWRGSFFSLFSRLQYVTAFDETILDNASFFWLSLTLYAFLMGTDLLAFAIAFFYKFGHELHNDNEGSRRHIPRSVAVTLLLQGALALGGLISNFVAFREVTRRRRKLKAEQEYAAVGVVAPVFVPQTYYQPPQSQYYQPQPQPHHQPYPQQYYQPQQQQQQPYYQPQPQQQQPPPQPYYPQQPQPQQPRRSQHFHQQQHASSSPYPVAAAGAGAPTPTPPPPGVEERRPLTAGDKEEPRAEPPCCKACSQCCAGPCCDSCMTVSVALGYVAYIGMFTLMVTVGIAFIVFFYDEEF